jgi:NADPH2:quinone reductase
MRAIQAASLSSIDDYRVVDLPMPSPGPAEVRIRIAACGVGYVDALVALGRYQVKPALPHVPGGEVAGWIDAIGEKVTELSVGDRVLAQVRGGFCEYAVVPTTVVSRIPGHMRFDQAAGFRINYVTALHGLRDRAHLQAGETLLVIGAAGGVGSAAVQVGALLGAKVVGVASTPEKRTLAASYGAEITLDRNPEGWRDRLRAAVPGGIDVVFDPACGALLQPAFRSLKWGGRHLVVGFVAGEIPALPVNLPLLKGAALVGVDYRQFADVFEAGHARRELDELLGWVENARLDPPAGRIFPFEQHREALTFALSGEGVAKTVFEVVAA